jgi:proliferating cell nuclear antigen PCNA
MSNKIFVFKARTVEGFTIKALAEVLQNILTDVCFSYDSTGISLLTTDNKNNLLVQLHLNADSFDEYYCPKPVAVGLNLQHLHKMLKSIKKKDVVSMFIKKTDPQQLGITTTQSDTLQQVTSHIKMQRISLIDTEIPTDYGHPIHIQTTTYQKMCKDIQSISNEIDIFAKDSYLKFSCKKDGMYAREIPFGELDKESESEEYTDVFNTKSLSQLIKISGLNQRMQVYIPTKNERKEIPLKVSINTGQLGKLEIYIKSRDQINSMSGV